MHGIRNTIRNIVGINHVVSYILYNLASITKIKMNTKNYTSLLYLWDKRTLYLGPLFEPIRMKNGAGSIAFSLTGTFKVKGAGTSNFAECKSFLVPPGASFTVFTGDSIIANCMLDVMGLDYAVLFQQMRQQGNNQKKHISFEIKDEQVYILKLQELYRNQYSWKVAEDEIDQLLTPSRHLLRIRRKIDPRVEKVVAYIKANITENVSIDLLAKEVNISAPHLVKIFKAQIGVPIRRYRLWHRLFVASAILAKSGNLTTAALSAGFSDAPHFLHTFRDVLGMRASLLLNQPNKISIITQPESE